MIGKNLLKFVALILVGLVIYTRKHFYVLIIALGIFILYHFNIHKKVYKLLNTITGNNKRVRQDRTKKMNYLKKMIKNSGDEI